MIGGLVARHTVTRKRAPAVDDGRGGLERDWTAATTAAIGGWAVDVGNTLEDTENRDGSLIQYTLRGPFAADVDDADRIVLFGDEFEIDGGIRRQPGPSAMTSHTVLLLKRWEG